MEGKESKFITLSGNMYKNISDRLGELYCWWWQNLFWIVYTRKILDAKCNN